MSIQESIKHWAGRAFIERTAGKCSLSELAARLEESGRQIEQRFAAAGDTPASREKLHHTVGIERWGQSRLRVALGEELHLDEYDGYRPAPDQGWAELLALFQRTRQETVGLAHQLEQAGAERALVSHNDWGDLSARGWLFYLNLHADLETRTLGRKGAQIPTSQVVVQIPLNPWLNVFLLRGSRGAVLVDAGMPGQAGQILDQAAAHSLAPEDIRLILLTHAHGDHYGSAAELRERTGAPIAIHAADAAALRGEVQDQAQPTNKLLIGLTRLAMPFIQTPTIEPDIVFEEEWSLEEYGIAGRVVPTPGHSPGSVSVVLDSGEVIVGDMVMGGMVGLLPRPGPPIIAWDRERNRESVQKLEDLEPKLVYASHGGPFAGLTAPAPAKPRVPGWGIALGLLVALVLIWRVRRR